MIAARCLPILALVSMNDDEEAFEVFADDMLQHGNMNELLSLFEQNLHAGNLGRRMDILIYVHLF